MAVLSDREVLILKYRGREAVRNLLQDGINLSAECRFGLSALENLAMNRNPGVIEELRDKNFDVNFCKPRNDSLLMIAASYNIPSTVQFFIERGANVNYTNGAGFTALTSAYKRNPSMRDRDNEFNNTKKCIQLLLQHGANPELEPYGKRIIFGRLMTYRRFMRVKFAVAHIAMLHASGKEIAISTLWEIHSWRTLTNYFALCIHLLQIKIYRSITMLQLLTDSDYKIFVFVRNPILLSKVKHIIYNKYDSNSYYFNRIQQRFKKAITTKRCANFLSTLFTMNYDNYYLIIDTIVKYLGDEAIQLD